MTRKGHVGSLWHLLIPPVANSLLPVTSAHGCLTFRSPDAAAALVFVFPFPGSSVFPGASLKGPNPSFAVDVRRLPQEQELQTSVQNDPLFSHQLLLAPGSGWKFSPVSWFWEVLRGRWLRRGPFPGP